MELARKCISDGANVNNNEVSYDVHVYHIEGSIGRMHYYDLNNLNFWKVTTQSNVYKNA